MDTRSGSAPCARGASRSSLGTPLCRASLGSDHRALRRRTKADASRLERRARSARRTPNGGRSGARPRAISAAVSLSALPSAATLDETPRRESAIPAKGRFVGTSPAFRKVVEEIERFAPFDVPVLLTGETGTGKSHAASLLHERSKRSAGPFVELNCNTFPETLMESELFG